MRARTVVIAVGLSAGALCLTGALLLRAYHGPTGAPETVVLLRPGIGARGVAAELAAHDMVRFPRLFLLFARLTGVDRRMLAGRYAIPERASMETILTLLRQGPNVRERVTIPEGSRSEEIAGVLARVAEVDSAAFLRIVRDSLSAERFHVPGPTLEGYLFPETYEFPWGIGASEIAALLIAQYRKTMTPELVARAENIGLGEGGAVVLASIIEAETALPEERPRVSAVFHNRLRKGWPLEADPTVRFATGNHSGEISVQDLAVRSPFNTYGQPGLPPAPIGNPGAASLRAALYPTEGCDDYFFVANGSGGHTFSRTLAAHAQAVARLRRVLSRGDARGGS